MHRILIWTGLLFAALPLFSQKRQLDFEALSRWKKIDQAQISNDGAWITYALAPTAEGDTTVILFNRLGGVERRVNRAARPKFTEDSRYLIFRIKPALDSLKAQRRRKIKEEDLPKDSLGILELATGQLKTIPRVRAHAVPEYFSGWVFCLLESALRDTMKSKASADSLKNARKPSKKIKKESNENGYRLLVYHLASGKQDTFPFVNSFGFAKKNPKVLFATSGVVDSTSWRQNSARMPGVYFLELDKQILKPLFRGKGKYSHVALDDQGGQAAFLADSDTSKARVRFWKLVYWQKHPSDTAKVVADSASQFLPQSWILSENARPQFSESGDKLFFGMAPPPILNDTTMLPEEIVNVEVWTTRDSRLYTEQKVRLNAQKKRYWPVIFYCPIIGKPVSSKKNPFVVPGFKNQEETDFVFRFQEERDASVALAFTEDPYIQTASWEGSAKKDVYVVDLIHGDRKLLIGNKRVRPLLSPEANFIAWWSDSDTAWFVVPAQTEGPSIQLTSWRNAGFFDETNDVPDFPDPYGIGGWIEGDEGLLVYDRYDIWRFDPKGRQTPLRLTRGRENRTIYRYIKLDPDERSIRRNARILLHTFSDSTKAEGYCWLDLNTGQIASWLPPADFMLQRQPKKARNGQVLLFTQQNFQTFPDLHSAILDDRRAAPLRISNANPWQSEYNWGKVELVSWTSLSGQKLQGLLVKPEDFDPAKKYPMVVNFYERLSDNLHLHRAPDAHRSTINYTMFASRGYIIFAPDIPYRNGYPGESAYDAVVSGVTDLIDRGFVDSKRIGLQGHSWGGYQAAYLITRTNLFRCAEAGAPVVNMTSAYGGIRWESGLSRMFQYERQQSRIGGSLWQYPLRYLENSPLFSLDKVQTPVLILHNDKDGAVPWYQGIEFFVGLRRLGKPAWLLNYNDEPHWPVKLQNRLDFQFRMQQFFDHYLLGTTMPPWMERGVPPIEKGIRQGY